MARRLLASCLAATLSFAASAALAAGFNTDAEGWTTSNGGDQVWMASGGNGGGWLQVTDITNDDFLLNAPVAWLGNWSAYAGGTLSFDARNINGDLPDWAPFGEVIITGSGGSLTFDMAPAGSPPADGQWHHYSFVLPSSAVLGNVTSLTIKGEFHAGVTEVVGIDNIQVTAVPEPTQAALLLGGLGLLALLRRRR
ncbi:hypothetical protein J2X20_002214 [Pelomonas saccharophila]|uniref:Ice-binding protein C-terminal domain-containing protein n=1 Tax=Roseateles saccharophilus TaxID=304 RepID=A0ABU1YMX0_ROSSA|nr:PEP-CTERM sorting domain-containing protein [Roseateles saccharophilus]MDR7269585.1 hypothetical protein [Roseateles saccharophilus]